ncbi:MAG: hypothetical protein DM484_12625 [Candidatus Methylumidiphilus alinenensis]|uniref:DUF2934 domain-containing protein n=1 Tax=Candidatus Methylumidiphilus alinenensis TaxID=2202197 RepID=A0A2W4R392_9GAMM|nr:MAG: hypothetical protein DM484_12625 [Candidatus Methylumidiphilus alinenensis]
MPFFYSISQFFFGFTAKHPSVIQMPNPEILESMVAEAAYYRANQRGFSVGNDLGDWLEAEKEIMERIALEN